MCYVFFKMDTRTHFSNVTKILEISEIRNERLRQLMLSEIGRVEEEIPANANPESVRIDRAARREQRRAECLGEKLTYTAAVARVTK